MTIPITSQKNTLVFYHDKCMDGLGAAYSAWKKFGEDAEYIPLSRGDTITKELCEGKEVYMLDFCFNSLEEMSVIENAATSLVVLDHHASVESVVKSLKEFRYDVEHSGAVIAWMYFHPEQQVPQLLLRIEDGDLWKNMYPETRALFTYLEVLPVNFFDFDRVVNEFEQDASREILMGKANVWDEYYMHLARLSCERAKLVEFEGHRVFFTNTHPMLSMRSTVGNLLCDDEHPFSLVVSAHPEGYGVSIRGNGTVDVSAIAQKYGGGGHKNAAGFQIKITDAIPWVLIDEK